MRKLDDSLVIAVFNAPGLQKQIAHDFGVSLGAVSNIKNGRRHWNTTAPWRDVSVINATLTTLAFTGQA